MHTEDGDCSHLLPTVAKLSRRAGQGDEQLGHAFIVRCGPQRPSQVCQTTRRVNRLWTTATLDLAMIAIAWARFLRDESACARTSRVAQLVRVLPSLLALRLRARREVLRVLARSDDARHDRDDPRQSPVERPGRREPNRGPQVLRLRGHAQVCIAELSSADAGQYPHCA